METVCLSKPAWLAAGLRFVLLGFVTLLLLPAPARSQSAWPQGDVGKTPAGVITSGRRPSRCPLPPASAFTLQTNLRKYLEAWPTPGSTATEAWPEYIPEDGEEQD
ncbi:MAG: hypothetical protein A2139_13740 [Desulfobacca sp. RBG_16_60_12]|nr:MAG: hypothetical protein A2139_13740 [Desulfobacca sp. RBG_16_60_12]